MSLSAKPMQSARAARGEQSRRRSDSPVCNSWFGETKETKSAAGGEEGGEEGGEVASEEAEKKEKKTKYSKLVLSLAVDAVRYSFVQGSGLTLVPRHLC